MPMRVVSKYFRSSYGVLSLIMLFIYFGATMCNVHSNRDDKRTAAIHGATEDYIGSHNCIKCHRQIFDTYINTGHYQTSGLVDANKFSKAGYNMDSVFYNEHLSVSVNKKADGFYQDAYSNGRFAVSRRMDLVMGSGKRGQTFLAWFDSSLYQLPLSYSFTLNKWINSPGYAADKVMFNRVVYIKCFECHASYANERIDEQGKPVLDSSRMVLGISCETCHGPAKKHVQYHTENPADKKASFIINTKNMNRQQQMDACASCHSGLRENIKPAFSFLPGDKLDEFFKPAYDSLKKNKLDVHGNQYGLLTASKCFKQSISLNCSSCHNVHQDETNKMEVFAQRCMNCHNDAANNFCTEKNTDRKTLISNCINCHMPVQPTGQIVFYTNEMGKKKTSNELIRTHLIGTYSTKK
jgi:hypothetical protein